MSSLRKFLVVFGLVAVVTAAVVLGMHASGLPSLIDTNPPVFVAAWLGVGISGALLVLLGRMLPRRDSTRPNIRQLRRVEKRAREFRERDPAEASKVIQKILQRLKERSPRQELFPRTS